jgi:uncharacterized protein YecT (DUF1311 family)
MRQALLALGSIVAITLTQLVPATAQNASTGVGLPKEMKCDGPTDRQVATCTKKQADLWDKSLNGEYKKALQRVTEESRPLLIKAQRLWIQFRDINCAVQFAQGGTVAAYYGEQCILDTTRNRAKELRMMGVQ